ncbi:MAG: hypothetical protein H7A38_03260 [Chlamydiales bacterium]|nr:hypothetical protein [Chlamydiales bacterium]
MDKTPSITPPPSPTPSPHPEPMKPFDRMMIVLFSTISAIIAYRSMSPGFWQKGVSITIFSAGTAYAFGVNCRCLQKTFKRATNGFDGCTLGGEGGETTYYPSFPSTGGWWSFGGSDQGGSFERQDSSIRHRPPATGGVGGKGTFEETDD